MVVLSEKLEAMFPPPPSYYSSESNNRDAFPAPPPCSLLSPLIAISGNPFALPSRVLAHLVGGGRGEILALMHHVPWQRRRGPQGLLDPGHVWTPRCTHLRPPGHSGYSSFHFFSLIILHRLLRVLASTDALVTSRSGRLLTL